MPYCPFREGLGTMYTSDEIPLLWKCWHCNYYTATIDQRTLEQHLLMTCTGIDPVSRDKYRLVVNDLIVWHSSAIGLDRSATSSHGVAGTTTLTSSIPVNNLFLDRTTTPDGHTIVTLAAVARRVLNHSPASTNASERLFANASFK
jgi:hypothetical protein